MSSFVIYSPSLILSPHSHFNSSASNSKLLLSSTHHSTFTFNSLILAETNAGNLTRALLLFHRMISIHFIPPDPFTFPTLLKACAHLPSLTAGEQIHSLLLKSHFASPHDAFILTSLVSFYSSFGRLKHARLLFDQMPHPNLPSCNAMLDGYAKSCDLEAAFKLFDEMPQRNVVTWNTMISGCVRNGLPWEALKLFIDFQMSGLKADESTMATLIAAVSQLGILSLGRKAHAFAARRLFSFERVLGAAFINMYAKCGSIGAAYNVFMTIESKNVAHWTSMIAGFASHGFADDALQLFVEMADSGVPPNDVTFIAVLNACSHGGLVREGLECFELMKTFGVKPGVKHYGCLVDLLGRAGLIDEAMELVSDMPVEPSPVMWSSLLAACRNYGRADVAGVAAWKLIELDSGKGSSFVLLSNLYAKLGRLEDCSVVRKVMEDRELTKVVGFSWIEIDGEVHEFVSGDMLHFKTREIYGVLDAMNNCLRKQGM